MNICSQCDADMKIVILYMFSNNDSNKSSDLSHYPTQLYKKLFAHFFRQRKNISSQIFKILTLPKNKTKHLVLYF